MNYSFISNTSIEEIKEEHTHKINKYIEIINSYRELDFDHSIKLLKDILNNAHSNKNWDLICDTLLSISILYYQNGNISDSLLNLQESYNMINSYQTKEKSYSNKTEL